jgi:FMN phosphatase YigB (HAD superfamily)
MRLICFDLGRVLVRIADGWEDACGHAGVERPAALDDPTASEKLYHLQMDFELGRADTREHTQQVAACIGVAPPQVLAILTAWLRGAFQGARELLADVSTKPVATACLSNTNAHHWSMMEDQQNANYLPLAILNFRFKSYSMGAMKPLAAVYEHVEAVSRISAEEIMFFDDSPVNVEAALRRGWQAHRIHQDRDPILQMRELLAKAGVFP